MVSIERGRVMATAAMVTSADGRTARIRFVATIFIGSFLLFLVQPMIARMALPRLGGAPAVWNSAMLVYQALLLAGYVYAHWLGRLPLQRQAAVHLLAFLVAGATLPIGLIAGTPSPDANPILWVPWLLVVSIGPLFFVVSAQAPLIQRWYSLAGSGDPYPLYAASNLGSFAGLLTYPLLVEPLIPIIQQRWLWSGAYVLLALLVAWCAVGLPRREAVESAAKASSPSPSWRKIGGWILIAAVPSGLILSTTLHLTTDVVAMPLLWVLPLGAYLLSFTVAFATNRAPANAIARLAPIILLICICVMAAQGRLGLMTAAVAVLNLFTVSVALHSRLFEQRPEPQHLTLFYVAMSVGGMLGGVFCALVAPLIFDWTYEHLLLLIAAAALMASDSLFDRFVTLWKDALASRLTIAGIAVVALLAVAGHPLLGLPESGTVSFHAVFAILAVALVAIGNRVLFTACVTALIFTALAWDALVLSTSPGKMMRSFFGIYSVETKGQDARTLIHGTTIHGVQNLGSEDRERMATTYYANGSGVGLAMAAAPRLFGDHARIGVVGLGAGTLGCYARPGQSWTFYEIDPLVGDIARDPSRFTFLSRCVPGARLVIGDARLSLEGAPLAATDLLVIDAFSSDSIPMHLLTREAFSAYRRHLDGDGLLLVHISNRHLDLEPVLAAAAAAGGWQARLLHFQPTQQQVKLNQTPSIWIALSPSKKTMQQLVLGGKGWRPLSRRRNAVEWTDDYASLLPLIRWRS